MNKWDDIKVGWGLQKVPTSLRKMLSCSWCLQADNGRGDLWTDESIMYSTPDELRRLIERLRPRVWCRMHAERYFKDSEVSS